MSDSAKNFLATAGGVLFSLAVFVMALFSAIQGVAFDLQRYRQAYETYDRPAYIGISMDELMDVTDQMLAYLKGQRPALDMQATINGQQRPVFGQREVAHMVDVQQLFLTGFALRNGMAVAAVLALLSMVITGARRWIRRWALCWYAVLGVLGVLALLYALWCLVDFSGAFTFFHHMLFSNDLWLLDPNYEVLIQMFPEEFFSGMAQAILLRFGGMLLAVTGLAAGLSLRNGKTRQKVGRQNVSL
ncbi:MAG: TIGR01906 family membrane protein [Eubacteriales bacterium]|nr:TIGR01906 family membrane protein [Eubacteriales bacterium]